MQITLSTNFNNMLFKCSDSGLLGGANQSTNQSGEGKHYPNANQLNCPQLALYINFTSFVHQFSSKKMMGYFFPILQVAEALFSILTNNFLVNILLSSASLLSPG